MNDLDWLVCEDYEGGQTDASALPITRLIYDFLAIQSRPVAAATISMTTGLTYRQVLYGCYWLAKRGHIRNVGQIRRRAFYEVVPWAAPPADQKRRPGPARRATHDAARERELPPWPRGPYLVEVLPWADNRPEMQRKADYA